MGKREVENDDISLSDGDSGQGLDFVDEAIIKGENLDKIAILEEIQSQLTKDPELVEMQRLEKDLISLGDVSITRDAHESLFDIKEETKNESKEYYYALEDERNINQKRKKGWVVSKDAVASFSQNREQGTTQKVQRNNEKFILMERPKEIREKKQRYEQLKRKLALKQHTFAKNAPRGTEPVGRITMNRGRRMR
jgi:hypothetical protein